MASGGYTSERVHPHTRALWLRVQALSRMVLFVFLASCSFGLEDFESTWAPDSARTSGVPRRGRIARTAASSHCVFRTAGGLYAAGHPVLAATSPAEQPSAEMALCGMVPAQAEASPVFRFPSSFATRGPPASV